MKYKGLERDEDDDFLEETKVPLIKLNVKMV
jgi:hypothetical protein